MTQNTDSTDESNRNVFEGRVQVRLEHTDWISRDRVQEWIDANALPGDKVVVTDPERDEETHHYVYDDEE